MKPAPGRRPDRQVFRDGAHGARSIWRWIPPPPTSAQSSSLPREGESPALPDLLGRVPEDDDIGAVTADADDANDTRCFHSAIIARGAAAITPIRKTGRPCNEDGAAALDIVLGPMVTLSRPATKPCALPATHGRAFWERWTGYTVCSRSEAGTRCLKSFGPRIAARDPDRQTAEIHIRVALMNRLNALAQPRSSASPDPARERGPRASGRRSATTPMDVRRHELGLAVPGDVAVAAFDDVPAAAWEAYAPTTIRQPVAALCARIAGEAAPPRRIRLPVTLVTRRSARIPQGWPP